MPSSNSNSRKSVRFAERVPPGETRRLTSAVQLDATVEQVDVRIYTGARLDLHVEPFVERGGQSDRTDPIPLVDLVGKDFVDGDGDRFTFYPTESVVGNQDAVGVLVENKDDEHPYDFAVDMTLDREGGAERGLLSRIRGWF